MLASIREESLRRVEVLGRPGGQPYAVISMVCSAACSGLGEMASSGSVTAVPRLRDPSVEPTLEAE